MLFTNDEELMVRMNNPQSGASRLYHIALGERVQSSHLEELKKGSWLTKDLCGLRKQNLPTRNATKSG